MEIKFEKGKYGILETNVSDEVFNSTAFLEHVRENHLGIVNIEERDNVIVNNYLNKYMDFKEFEKLCEFSFDPKVNNATKPVYDKKGEAGLNIAQKLIRRAKHDSSDNKTNLIAGLIGSMASNLGIAFVGTSILSGLGLTAVMAGFAASYALTMFATNVVRNSKVTRMNMGARMPKTVQTMIFETYLQAIKSLFNKRDIAMDIKTSGMKIILVSQLRLPKKAEARIIITIEPNFVSVYPENTGGSGALDSIIYSNNGMDINPNLKRSAALEKVIKDAGGLNGIIGQGYKLPRRALTYQTDMLIIWYVIVDLISEMYADYAQYYGQKVGELQLSKESDKGIFEAVQGKYDLTKQAIDEAEASMKRKVELAGR